MDWAEALEISRQPCGFQQHGCLNIYLEMAGDTDQVAIGRLPKSARPISTTMIEPTTAAMM